MKDDDMRERSNDRSQDRNTPRVACSPAGVARGRKGADAPQRRACAAARELPWVRVEKDYRFATEDGDASLRDLFGGRSQLLVYHFMFDPDWDEGCPNG